MAGFDGNEFEDLPTMPGGYDRKPDTDVERPLVSMHTPAEHTASGGHLG